MLHSSFLSLTTSLWLDSASSSKLRWGHSYASSNRSWYRALSLATSWTPYIGDRRCTSLLSLASCIWSIALIAGLIFRGQSRVHVVAPTCSLCTQSSPSVLAMERSSRWMSRPSDFCKEHHNFTYKNIERHTAHTVVSWPNPELWIIIHMFILPIWWW